MQKNYEQNTSAGWNYQPHPSQSHAQSYAHSLPPQPPSYDQATHVHISPPLESTAATQVVIIQQPVRPAVGPDPCFISCPHCHVQKLTRVEYAPSVRTHCMAALLCIVGLWCFACLPYCATSCMNANHFCGNCNQYVGVYSSD